ncbi:MAG: Type secretion system protein, partial [Pseudomonadota bacterium]|nr:Type secretion system protein [Pseudomonadota bacterium]
MNELNALQVARTWPDLGTETKTVTMAGHDWPVQRETLETADPATHAVRFTVYVDAERKQAVSHLQGYLSQHTGASASAAP